MSLGRRLAIVLVAVAVGSVVVLGVVNYWAARSVLADEVGQQLASLQAEQATAIRDGLDRVRERAAVAGADGRVAAALVDLAAARDDLASADDLVDDADVAALEEWYADNVLAPLEAVGIEVDGLDLLPTTEAGRALQLRYTLDRPPSGDLGPFEAAHDRHAAGLEQLASLVGLRELLLVDTSGNVVFSVDKSIDFGTNLVEGPYRESGLADALRRELPSVPAGDGVFVDFSRYLPAGGAPIMFVAAAVRDDAEVVGAIALELDASALTELTTAGGRWSEIGLGDTGETYVVGADRLLRSDSRLWLEDPDEYLRALDGTDTDPRVAELVPVFDSTILLQPAETRAVDAALDGEVFSGSTRNYLGRPTRTVASPVGIGGLDWVIVADITTSESDDAIDTYLRDVLVLAAVVVPVVWLCGVWFARRLTRPVHPLVEAADRVASGDLDATAPELGDDELGDLARQLNDLTADLRAQELALATEEAAVTEMLLAALPSRVVQGIRSGEQELADLVDRATVVSITTAGLLDEHGREAEAIELAAHISQRLERLADERGVERSRSSADHHLFTAGLGSDDDGAETAAAFVLAARDVIETAAEEADVDVGVRAGLATGDLATGLLGTGQLSFGIWGEPPRRALALDAVAGTGQILVDPAFGEAVGPAWRIEPLAEQLDLSGAPIEASELVGEVGADVASG